MGAYSSKGKKTSHLIGYNLLKDISHHVRQTGGTITSISGSMGSGKTTLLLTLASTTTCENPDTGATEKETIIWRGRPDDSWNWIPKESECLFIHAMDWKSFKILDDHKRPIPKEQLPPIVRYVSFADLYYKLKKGRINIVYEPSSYTLTENVKDQIRARGMSNQGDIFKGIDAMDPVLFWYEMILFLGNLKNSGFISVILDEFDEICNAQPTGCRWHLSLWLKDLLKDLRKKRISLIFASHSYTDWDGRLIPKIQYWIFMKGAPPVNTNTRRSMVHKTATLMLEPGQFFIERSGWGRAKCEGIPPKTIVHVTLTPGKKIQLVDDIWQDDDQKPSLPISLDTPATTHNPKPSPAISGQFISIKGSSLLRDDK